MPRRRSWSFSLLSFWVLGAFFGCGGPPAPPKAAPESVAANATSTDPAPRTAAGPAKEGEKVAAPNPGPLSAEAARLRAQGLAALDEGRYLDAREAFDGVLQIDPSNLAAAALLKTADEALKRAQTRAAADLATMKPLRLPSPPFDYTLVERLQTPAGPMPRLVVTSQARNSITDSAAWYKRNALRPLAFAVPNPFRGFDGTGNLPQGIPTTFGNLPLVKAIGYSDHTILLYGANFSGAHIVGVLDDRRVLVALFDFSQYLYAPNPVAGEERFVSQLVQWAEAREGVLYVQNNHRTYAKSSRGQNAYLSAIELRTGKLLWRSAPLVANSGNFVIDGPAIVAGYGFTAEPDYLTVLDRATGKLVSRATVASGPEAIIKKDDKLFVRTYDTDYVFAVAR